jgi:hypothetical protein
MHTDGGYGVNDGMSSAKRDDDDAGTATATTVSSGWDAYNVSSFTDALSSAAAGAAAGAASVLATATAEDEDEDALWDDVPVLPEERFDPPTAVNTTVGPALFTPRFFLVKHQLNEETLHGSVPNPDILTNLTLGSDNARGA